MDFFEDLLNNKKKKKDQLKNLYKIPKKDKGENAPKFQPVAPGIYQQADLLFLPNDKGYKYALTVIDTGSNQSDAEPLKTKEQTAIIKAFDTIYGRGYISLPKVMQVDAGKEFGSRVKKWFADQGVSYRVAEVGRHRQQAKVERLNQTIGTLLTKRMSAQELITDKTSRAWVKDLPILIKALNKKKQEDMKKKRPYNPDDKLKCEGDACEGREIC
jgi:hypothetical protein